MYKKQCVRLRLTSPQKPAARHHIWFQIPQSHRHIAVSKPDHRMHPRKQDYRRNHAAPPRRLVEKCFEPKPRPRHTSSIGRIYE
eukprot:2192914-Rhodomonas_salina.1